jgi:type III restriction enzyme
VLNTVDLFLPHYDAAALNGVLARLRNPEAEEGLPTRVETAAVAYPRNPKLSEVFNHLKTLPTYLVSRTPKMGEVKRALRLSGLLVHEGVYTDADETIREVLTSKLSALRDSAVANDPKWNATVREGSEVDVDVTFISIGEMNVSGRKNTKMTLSEENIEQLFNASGRILAASEGLHRSYWKRYHDHARPNGAKLELFALVRTPGTLEELEKLARSEFERLWKEYMPAIQRLPAAERARFHALVQASGRPTQLRWELTEQIVEKMEGEAWKHHLYCDAQGVFYAQLNTWENQFLREAMQEKDFVCWLRNFPRREWAFCVPYELGGMKPFYPDFIVVRKKGVHYQVDVLEPHDDSRSDTWAKAKGLAVFADEHGMEFGRLRIGRMRGQQTQFADMNDPSTRAKARKMQSQSDLESLFS